MDNNILNNFVKQKVINLNYTFKTPDVMEKQEYYTFEGDLWKCKTFTLNDDEYLVCVDMDQEFAESYKDYFWNVTIETNNRKDKYIFSNDESGYNQALDFYSLLLDSLRGGASQVTDTNIINIDI